MRFIHISDLHIGKKISGVSLEKDQKHILARIVEIAKEQKADAVLIAGDVYDSTTPPNESYNILDGFLTDLSKVVKDVFLISGNHDSNDKLGYGKRLFDSKGIHIASNYEGSVSKFTVGEDEKTDVFMLPFVKPYEVRYCHPDSNVESYEDAVRTAISNTDLSGNNMKILVAHQYVTNCGKHPKASDSEMPVGGIDNVDYTVFDGFDYVALGHIHGAQWVGREQVRYCGTPLKYSKSEVNDTKSVTVVDISLGKVSIETVPLDPLRDVRIVKGTIKQIADASREYPEGKNDLVYAELTENEFDAINRLRDVYPNTLNVIDASKPETATVGGLADIDAISVIDINKAFEMFYAETTGKDLSTEQKKIIRDLIEEVEL